MTARERFDEAAKAGWDAGDEPPRNEDAEALMVVLDCPDVYGHRDDITRWFNERSQATAALPSEPPSDPERLDVAWAAAEAALPTDMPWELSVEGKSGHFVTATAHNLRDATAFVIADGRTPAAALRALAARLNDTAPEPSDA